MSNSVEILEQFAHILEDLGIRYVVVGSFASSARGQPRSTLDADLVAEIRGEHIAPLVRKLETDYYVDSRAIRLAILSHSAFNAIHLHSMFKLDVYVSGTEKFDEEQLVRRLPEKLKEDSETVVYVATAEDTVLAKLIWFNKGHGVSERQWNDVLGVLAVQRHHLDLGYLNKWADNLGIRHLLDKAISETA